MLELQEGHIGVDGWDLGFRRLDIAVVELGERPAGGPEAQREPSWVRRPGRGDLTINDAPAQVGRQPAAAGDQTWILEAQTSSGQTFSLQAPAGFTRDQIIRISESVTYRQ